MAILQFIYNIMSNARLVVGMGLCKTQSEENSVQAIVICIDH